MSNLKIPTSKEEAIAMAIAGNVDFQKQIYITKNKEIIHAYGDTLAVIRNTEHIEKEEKERKEAEENNNFSYLYFLASNVFVALGVSLIVALGFIGGGNLNE